MLFESHTYPNQVNRDLDKLRTMYALQWNKHDVDAIICPANASVASVHDENRYWGYTCVWNALDYPAVIFPVGTVQRTDIWRNFPPLAAPLNSMDSWSRNLYTDSEGPLRYEGAPISLQIVGRRLQGERVLRITKRVVDILRCKESATPEY